MPFVEDVDELVEWLANQANIWGNYADEAMTGHLEDCNCRICWTMDVRHRMRQAVSREIHMEKKLEGAHG